MVNWPFWLAVILLHWRGGGFRGLVVQVCQVENIFFFAFSAVEHFFLYFEHFKIIFVFSSFGSASWQSVAIRKLA